MIHLIDLAERTLWPNWLIRPGMRRLLAGHPEEEQRRGDA
jgi:hypothetical protein